VTPLRLTVAGSSSSIPRIGRACSAYLVEDGGFRFTLDFGTGAFANMRQYADYHELDAVVISHMHADHFLDLIPLRYAMKYGAHRRKTRLPLWTPPGGEAMLRMMTGAFASEGDDDFLAPFDVHEFDPAKPLPLGDGTLRFAATTHYIDAYAIRYQRNGTSLTYSADTAPDQRVVDLARETNLFLCEATLLAGAIEGGGVRGHSSAAEAAQMAADAGCERLVLTHYGENATPRDLDESARPIFGGAIVVADDHAVLTVAT
jgi:ribonuclease BN (tRNA processing enzyme)